MVDCNTTLRFLSGAISHISLLIVPLSPGPAMLIFARACSVRAPLSFCPDCVSNCCPLSATGEDVAAGVADGEFVDEPLSQAASASMSSTRRHGSTTFIRCIDICFSFYVLFL